MVVSTAPHLRESYVLWRRFSLPVDSGTRDAYSVPNSVADQLLSAYTIMVTSIVMNLWCILFAIAFFWLLKRDNKPHIVSTSLWNKRASLTDSFLELIQPSAETRKEHWRQWWIYPAILVVLICWIAQNVLSIIVPPYINIGHAAPVNPSAVYAPSNLDSAHAARAGVFSLDVPAALRAVGSAQVASKDILSKVSISHTTPASPSSFPATGITYNYSISGSDLGLQYYPTLRLTVTGACRTEYKWLMSSDLDESLGGGGFTTDTYALFGDNNTHGTIALNIFDGPAPVAYFYTNPDFPPDGPPGNRTWAAFISSVDRVSFTPGTDPFYLTTPLSSGNNDNLADTNHVVLPKRPALSCWQLDEWTYNGAKATITNLTSANLPGLDLSLGMRLILARYLSNPKVVDIGKQLGLSNLLSSTTSLGNIFDAGGSSAFSDLSRLVLAAYIGSTNTLTDLTLYPQSSSSNQSSGGGDAGQPTLSNLAFDENGNPREGVAQFVIYSSAISTLSIKALIVIPVLALVFWLLALGLLTWSPLSKVNALDATVLHRTLEEKFPGARPQFVRHGRSGSGRGSSWVGESSLTLASLLLAQGIEMLTD
ncbi:hypothetical protein V8F33_006317 [Rhypophila sp. PSN 637]